MKALTRLVFTLLFLGTTAACTDTNIGPDSPGTPEEPQNEFVVTIDGVEWTAPEVFLIPSSKDADYVITGHTSDYPDGMAVSLNLLSLKPGVYELSNNPHARRNYAFYGPDLVSIGHAYNGTVTITEKSDNYLEGHFAFVAATREGERYILSEGRFKVSTEDI